MGKRGNENSQLSKEEYDALQARGGSGSVSDKFSKASSETLGRRRIVKTSRKWKAAKAEASSPSTGSSNPFASFSFSKSSAAPATAAPAASSKPSFAMPSASSKLPTSTTFSMGGMGDSSAKKVKTDAVESGKLGKLCGSVRKYTQTANQRECWDGSMTRFITTYLKLEKENKKTESRNDEPTTTKPLFPSTKTSSPAPAPFSFGAPAPAPSPASKAPSFSFGSTSSAPAPSTSIPSFSFSAPKASASPAPAPSSGFSFSLAPATAPAPSPAPAAASESTPAEEGGEKEETAELESADQDWNLAFEVKVKVYHHRTGDAKKFATGMLKLQEKKSDAKIRRMVMRDIAGKVLLNLSITKDMKFDKSVTPGRPGKQAVCRIVFMGLMDKDRGAEMFTIVCRPSDMDKLHEKLQSMTS